MDRKNIENAIAEILVSVGENPAREGLMETPKRVSRMYEELLRGMEQNPDDHLKLFQAEGSKDMVVVKDIPIFSLCEHHMLPFYGKCHIGYIPVDKILGLSKFPRIINCFARRLQVQERLCKEISSYFMEKLEAEGVICHIEAEHMCVLMRGVKALGSKTVTVSKEGLFRENSELTKEFLEYLK